VIGDKKSPPKRIRIDVLETLVRQLRETVDAVRRDIGLDEADVTTVELVDLEAGSSGMVWEQASTDPDVQLPLALTMEGLAPKSRGRPYRPILTDASRRSIDDLVAVLADFGARGIPIQVEDIAPGTEGRTLDSATIEELVLVPFSTPAGGEVDGASISAGSADDEEADDKGGEWLLRFTAEVQRIDRDRKIWLRIAGALKQIKPKLSPELFSAVDSDEARWKRVEVTAMAAGTTIEDITDVLHIIPAATEIPLEVTPMNEAASSIQPLLDRIEKISRLSDGWDSYSAKAIAPTAISDAKKFLILTTAESKVRGRTLTHPFVAPVSTGSLQMEWEKQPFHLALEFSGKEITYIRAAGDDSVEGTITRSQALDFVTWFHEATGKPIGGRNREEGR